MADDDDFSLEQLERSVYRRQHEAAARETFKLLARLNRTKGTLAGLELPRGGAISGDEREAHLATRIASALSALFADPAFRVSRAGLAELMGHQRWLATIFGASPFANADHVLFALNAQDAGSAPGAGPAERELAKFSLLYSLDSGVDLEPDVLWAEDRRMAAKLYLSLLSSRVVASERAHRVRERLLEWLPARLGEIAFEDVALELLHAAWLYCSYAELPGKHEIKRAINALARNWLQARGVGDVQAGPRPARDKPVVMVVTELFDSLHPIYRTHSASVDALRAAFHVVGVCQRERCDRNSRACFDEWHCTAQDAPLLQAVQTVVELAARLKPDIVYFLGVGMLPDTVLLCNLRLAPIQMVSWGHSASTFAPCVDYFLVEEDLFGDAAVFSETVLALPAGSLPYRKIEGPPAGAARARPAHGPVRIAVTASVMKLNAKFLRALRRVAEGSTVPVEFHFLAAGARGLTKLHLWNRMRGFLPNGARLLPESSHEDYIAALGGCDMFLSPFPFGNCNGIVDAVGLGLAGVCLSGAEIHSHIDEGYLKRFGLPDWLVASSVDEYVSAAIKLAADPGLRAGLAATRPEWVSAKAGGRRFAEAVRWLLRQDAVIRRSGLKRLTPQT